MGYITQDGIIYQCVPGGKRFINPGEYWVSWTGRVHRHDGYGTSTVECVRVIPIKRIKATN